MFASPSFPFPLFSGLLATATMYLHLRSNLNDSTDFNLDAIALAFSVGGCVLTLSSLVVACLIFRKKYFQKKLEPSETLVSEIIR